MMMRHQPIIVLFLLSCVLLTQSRFRRLYDFEADNGICTGGCELRERSGASNGLATFMQKGDKLLIQFKTESNCSVSIENVRYSTNGSEQDTINVTLANIYLGSFNTTSQAGGGHLWNNSGHVGPIVPLSSGFYKLILTVSTDNFGVEVDKITLNFNCDSDPGKLQVFWGNTTYSFPTLNPSVNVGILLTNIFGPIILSSALFSVCVWICTRKKRNQYEQIA